MDPFEAVKLLVARGDGSSFMNRTLRMDLARSPEEGDTAPHGFDPHSTIFVGSLDFAAHEEDLRAYFESVMVAEQGPPPDDIRAWVQGVRIIRDKDTQLGKGFAYVKFAVGLWLGLVASRCTNSFHRTGHVLTKLSLWRQVNSNLQNASSASSTVKGPLAHPNPIGEQRGVRSGN